MSGFIITIIHYFSHLKEVSVGIGNVLHDDGVGAIEGVGDRVATGIRDHLERERERGRIENFGAIEIRTSRF